MSGAAPSAQARKVAKEAATASPGGSGASKSPAKPFGSYDNNRGLTVTYIFRPADKHVQIMIGDGLKKNYVPDSNNFRRPMLDVMSGMQREGLVSLNSSKTA